MRRIAREAGIDPRGTAGYYNAGLLEMREPDQKRWLTKLGEARLSELDKQLEAR